MNELVFLLEERSAAAMLESLLPRLLDQKITPRFVSFEGKRDLAGQLERRLRGYANPNARFIVMHDQDRHPDCKALKGATLHQCASAGKAHLSLVRIACRELEAFYLGDLAAVEQALGITGIAKRQMSARFRQPDTVSSPSLELLKLTNRQYQKVNGSREIGKYLDLANVRSTSFNQLIAAIHRMQAELLTQAE